MILQHLDLWKTRNQDPPPGKALLKFIPENVLHVNQGPNRVSFCHGKHLIDNGIFISHGE